jgi:hypothetical protein
MRGLMAADRSDQETFRPAVKIAAAMLFVVVFFVLAELLLRFAPLLDATQTAAPKHARRSELYTKEGLSRALPRFTERQGRDCVEIRGGFNWNPRFGFASKKLDKDCARKLFSSHEKSVVLMGGSAMEDTQAPNYLTSIDTYAFGNDPAIASLNLAESGARLSNMLIRFLDEVVELHPTYVVFLDGFNEFNSVRYGGEPDDDFYWTAGVKDRVHRPFMFLRDKLVDSSRLVKLLAEKLRFINSARIVRSDIDPRLVEQAAENYVKTRAYTEVICKAYAIKCIFMIQPIALLEKVPSESAKRETKAHLQSFQSDVQVYGAGYNYIFGKAGDKVRDASHLFEGKDNVYVDVVHFNKRGAELIGDYIRAAIE